jgi:hypothetical protein
VLFRLRQFVDLADVSVGEFLYFFKAIALVVFRDLFVLQHLLQTLICVATNVSHRGAVVFRDLVNLFRKLLATFFGERRDGDSYQFAIV